LVVVSLASNLVMGPMPDLPATRADHVSSTPIANGVTKPRPVITTRLFIVYSYLLRNGKNAVSLVCSLAQTVRQKALDDSLFNLP
jgi:hypothetical protein